VDRKASLLVHSERSWRRLSKFFLSLIFLSVSRTGFSFLSPVERSGSSFFPLLHSQVETDGKRRYPSSFPSLFHLWMGDFEIGTFFFPLRNSPFLPSLIMSGQHSICLLFLSFSRWRVACSFSSFLSKEVRATFFSSLPDQVLVCFFFFLWCPGEDPHISRL